MITPLPTHVLVPLASPLTYQQQPTPMGMVGHEQPRNGDCQGPYRQQNVFCSTGGGGMMNSAPMKRDQNYWSNNGRMDGGGGNRQAGHVDAGDNRGTNMANQGMWYNPQQSPHQPQWRGGPGPVAQGHGNMIMGIGGMLQQQPKQAPHLRGMPPPPIRGMPNKMDNLVRWGGHGQTRNGGCQHGPDGPQEGRFNSAGGRCDGWNDDINRAISLWEESELPQNNSWNKPKTPTSSNSSCGNDKLFDISNIGVAPNKPPEEELERLKFRTSTINLIDEVAHVVDPLAKPPSVGVVGDGRPMGGPWGNAQDNGEIEHQGRGPSFTDDHFELALGPGGPTRVGPPPPQPRGGFPPNPNGFSDEMEFNPANVISTAQLQLLAQKARMAVQAGYLGSQILNHPLPEQSVDALNQLLQEIELVHQFTEMQRQIGKNNSSEALQLSAQITKSKQTIANLHAQIAAQQAVHAKQQQQLQQPHPLLAGTNVDPGNPSSHDKAPPGFEDNRGVGSSGSSMMDPFRAPTNNFGSDVGAKDNSEHQQTSKLGQSTKLSSLEKEDNDSVSKPFNRAPGYNRKHKHKASSNIQKKNFCLILGQTDNTWSPIAPCSGDNFWPTGFSSLTSQNVANSCLNQLDDSSKTTSNVNLSTEAWPADSVIEFEPGKPWKGTQMMKSVDDDSTLTPGSSSSNPWSFTPTSSGSTSIDKISSLAKSDNKKDDLGVRDLWDYNNPAGCAPVYRPQPSLPKNNPESTWLVAAARDNNNLGTNSSSLDSLRNNSTSSKGDPGPGDHRWLILRNLTTQIDMHIIKILCSQYGPLLKFDFYKRGVVMVKYSTSEEAKNAQRAWNNYRMGNTTIVAETR